MALKTQTISSIRPFECIACPVCGGHEFTSLGDGGGVWCDECNAEFKVRATGGDAGCVVDCKLEGLYHGYDLVLRKRGLMVVMDHYPFGHEPGIYFYKVMKCPMEDGSSGEESSWIMTSRSLGVRTIWADKEQRRPIWEYQPHPMVTKEEERRAVQERNDEIPFKPTSA